MAERGEAGFYKYGKTTDNETFDWRMELDNPLTLEGITSAHILKLYSEAQAVFGQGDIETIPSDLLAKVEEAIDRRSAQGVRAAVSGSSVAFEVFGVFEEQSEEYERVIDYLEGLCETGLLAIAGKNLYGKVLPEVVLDLSQEQQPYSYADPQTPIDLTTMLRAAGIIKRRRQNM
jgi:hypothetical protein